MFRRTVDGKKTAAPLTGKGLPAPHSRPQPGAYRQRGSGGTKLATPGLRSGRPMVRKGVRGGWQAPQVGGLARKEGTSEENIDNILCRPNYIRR